jgi:hypothetical protein
VNGNEDVARALSSHVLETVGEPDVIETVEWSGGGEGLGVMVKANQDLVEVGPVTLSHPGFGSRDPLSVTFADQLNRLSAH